MTPTSRIGALALLALSAAAHAQTSRLEFDAAKVPQGSVLHYKKSNLDGSRATRVSVYVADTERLESLKWDEDSTEATLVKARMDWPRFSVREFQSFHLERGKAPELRGTLQANARGTEVKVSFLDGKVVKITHWPWHSYDFDFASLGLMLPHLKNPEADLLFWRTDVKFVGEHIDFAEIGSIRLVYEADELRETRLLRRYVIGGEGLEHRYGKLWTDARTGLIVEYRLPIGDEPGFKDVLFRLDRQEQLTADQWEAFKRAKLAEH